MGVRLQPTCIHTGCHVLRGRHAGGVPAPLHLLPAPRLRAAPIAPLQLFPSWQRSRAAPGRATCSALLSGHVLNYRDCCHCFGANMITQASFYKFSSARSTGCGWLSWLPWCKQTRNCKVRKLSFCAEFLGLRVNCWGMNLRMFVLGQASRTITAFAVAILTCVFLWSISPTSCASFFFSWQGLFPMQAWLTPSS